MEVPGPKMATTHAWYKKVIVLHRDDTTDKYKDVFTQADILKGNLLGYKGAIFENLMADFLCKSGQKLYYF